MNAREKLVDAYVHRIRNNEIEFDQIRKELEARNIDDDTISSVVREVDQVLRTELTATDTGIRANKLLFFGAITALFGAVLTVGSLFGWFSTSGSPVGVIAYGPLSGGSAAIYAALRAKARLETEVADRRFETAKHRKTKFRTYRRSS